MTGGRRGRGGRPAQLDREQIVGAAVGVIDADGLDALTMRRLGSELGVAAMSLYRHFENREAVLAAVVNTLATEGVPELDGAESWTEAARLFARSYRAMLLAHPNAVPLLAVQPVDIDAGMALMTGVLERFTEADVGSDEALTIIQSIGVFTLGHALAQVGKPPGSPESAAAPEAYYDGWFEAGLTAMIAGFAEFAASR